MSTNSSGTFKVLLTADFFDDQGRPKFADLGLSEFANQSHIEQSSLAEHHKELGAAQIEGAQGVIVLTPSVTAATVANSADLLAIGRFGVGYDEVDVEACTRSDVAVVITAGAVDRPVAEATVGWMIALTHHFRAKDQLVRSGRWDDRVGLMGSELRDRTLGIVGLGGIGRAVVQMLAGFGMNPPIAFDPYAEAKAAEAAGVRLVELDELMQQADFVSIHCPLTDDTRDLIGPDQISQMKSNAYLLNTARGGIVNEDALYAALLEKRIAGAALDCFVDEPIKSPHRFGELDNVLLAPHSIAWTEELFRDIGITACRSMVDLSRGKKPRGVVNQEVFDRPGFQEKWSRHMVAQGN